MAYGIDKNGFTVKRLPEIKKDMEESFRQAFGQDAKLLPDSPEGQIISIFSEIVANQWEELQEAYNSFNPLYVTNQALDNLAFFTGVKRIPNSSSNTYVDITGVDGTIIPSGSIVSHNVSGEEFLTAAAVTIGSTGGFPTTTARVLVNARDSGAVSAAAGTLTVIGSPVNGWNTVTNITIAKLGRNVEKDTELRARRNRLLYLSGSSSLDAILSDISLLDGVVHSGGKENFFDTTSSDGIPAHAFEAVISGGDDNEIAKKIYSSKRPVGINPHGSTSVNVIDEQGNTVIIKFTKPTAVLIYFRATLSFDGDVPSDASTVLTEDLLKYVNGELISGISIGVGENVVNSRLYTPLNISYLNHTVSNLETSIDGTNWSANDIVINYKSISSWDASRIIFTVG